MNFLGKCLRSPSLTHGSNWLFGKMLNSPSLTHGSDGLLRRKFKKSIGHIIKLIREIDTVKNLGTLEKLDTLESLKLGTVPKELDAYNMYSF